MNEGRRLPGLAFRIALVAVATSGVALLILAGGVWVAGGDAFGRLMVEHGAPTEGARSMFDTSITTILIITLLMAVVASAVLAMVLARRLTQPIADVGAAARRIAEGDYSIRVPREGGEELVSLADSFNQMAASLAEQERMRRDFIANAAHELRTPLTNLEGYLEGLRDGVITADASTYDSLLEEAERLVRLANSLDQLAEGDRSEREPIPVDTDLAGALASAVELVRPAFEGRRIAVTRSWPTPMPARADPDALAQVLANLLQNAMRYTDEGGSVDVRAERRAGGVLMTVTNTGEGIPREDLPRVFERFYRVEKSRDRATGGAGIGLAVVKQLVEAWGGRVGAESSAGETSFWFTLSQR
ncbi:MAG: ATP-binding protein [Candidatus Limnocylindrales bacterium]